MPLPVNHQGNLRHQFLQKQLATTSIYNSFNLTDKQKANAKKWITRYRRNWDLFCEEILQVKLYPLQKFSIHMAGISQEYFEIASRGCG